MPGCKCCFSSLWRNDLAVDKESGNNDFDYVEVDPTGRYGRYEEVLGKGAFKTVYRAFDQEDGIEVAWNQIQVQDVVQTPDDLDRLYSEVNLLKTLKHKNIMKFYHSWVDKKTNNVNFITEIFTSGTLRQYRKRHKHVDIKAVKNWSRQILRGLLYLHSHDPPIIHRDLKCDNILINGNQGEVKIGDLGLATILQHARAARSVIGTPEFMAPELYEEEYTELADIYSFGMCLLEMVTSEYPYSECTNAAQIFKKVTSGKKPEALKKVKDPGIRKLIERCLAKASERLPARDLLMDPFLQSESAQESEVSVQHTGMVMEMSDMVDLEVIMEEPHGLSATVQISYKLKETLPSHPDDCHYGHHSSACGDLKAGPIADHTNIADSCKPVSSCHSKEDRARSVDFRVKGNISEDDTVFLRLRIADSEGKVRNIHFPFDVESDTAMCVASEMVAELDLTDQDVTKIADMIDAAILTLIPEWKPGVAIDDTPEGKSGVAVDENCGDGDAFLDHESGFDDGYPSMRSVLDPLTTMFSDDWPEESSSNFPRGATQEAVSSPRKEGTVYGRFEQVTYQCHRSDFPVSHTEQCTVSTGLPELFQAEGDWQPKDDSKSPPASTTSTAPLPEYEAVTPLLKECFGMTDVRITNRDETATAFKGFLGFKGKGDCSNSTHKTREGLVQGNAYPLFYTSAISAIPSVLQGDKTLGQEAEGQKLQQVFFASPSWNFWWALHDECDDQSAVQELTELALKHEQELQELQSRHEEALTELRNRWQQRKSSKPSSSSIVNHYCCQGCECQKCVELYSNKDTLSLGHYFQNSQMWEVPFTPSRNVSNVSSVSTKSSNSCSCHELQGVTPRDVFSVDNSVSSSDDLSNLRQFTPSSSKSDGWMSRDAFLSKPSTGETLFSLPVGAGMDCKSSTLRTQNSVKSGPINLCIPMESQTLEQMV